MLCLGRRGNQWSEPCTVPLVNACIGPGRVSRAKEGGGAQEVLTFQGFGTCFPLKDRNCGPRTLGDAA